ncbi:hypothetical protein CRENBAI_016820 [Crenichthys baileyi]|uniref:Uncharacterized protein n=1 Tax=Crenichthys baileyi TaxID=28760 RepID=A0AAV9REW6_9TELE
MTQSAFDLFCLSPLYEPPPVPVCLYLSISPHRSISLSCPVMSGREQSLINAPGWFLVASASSDVHPLQFIKKKHSLYCTACCSRLFFLVSLRFIFSLSYHQH